MGKVAENPSVTECLDSPSSGEFSTTEQRKEAVFRRRNHVPMITDKVRANLECVNITDVSDDCHESGGTQKLQVKCELHSHSETGQALHRLENPSLDSQPPDNRYSSKE